MTRDFNNQRREDQRRDSRGSSPRRYGGERPPRPARPRINRDTVDRAWENGARQTHADYRTRSDNSSHSTQDNRQRNQYSAQKSRNYSKPYGNRQDSYRTGEHAPHSNYGPRPHSYESGMRTFNKQDYTEHKRHGYADRSNQAEYRSDNRPYSHQHNSRSEYRDRDQYRGPQRRDFDRETRQPFSSNREKQHSRDYDRESRQPRSYDRDKRSYRSSSRPGTQNPRWQSRPARNRSNYSSRPQEFSRFGTEEKLFEGDYEHFDASGAEQPNTIQSRGNGYTPNHGKERNVTRLSDGRVLKGSPHKQRGAAEFWTDIAHESDELVQQVELSTTVEAVEAIAVHSADTPTTTSPKEKTKSLTHTGSTVKRDRKTKDRQSSPKPRSTGPKPSQRGYKWPTPEE